MPSSQAPATPSAQAAAPTPAEAAAPPRHVVVTGATGGVGRALVALLEAQGDTVTGLDLPDHDVTDAAAIAATVRALDARQPIDALVHAAGVLHADAAVTPDPQGLSHSLQVNVGGVVNVCSVVAELMIARGRGAIVVVSSNAATTPRMGMASYCASKAAATAWTRVLALECAGHGVRCNIVSPGSTDTPMLRGMWPEGTDQSARVIAGSPEEFRLGIPDATLGSPEDIAAACAFLISPAARHITMHDLRVDGGATLDS